jgi:hypothetical protein
MESISDLKLEQVLMQDPMNFNVCRVRYDGAAFPESREWLINPAQAAILSDIERTGIRELSNAERLIMFRCPNYLYNIDRDSSRASLTTISQASRYDLIKI